MPLPQRLTTLLFAAICTPVAAVDFRPISAVTLSSGSAFYSVENLIQGSGSGFAATEPHDQLGSGGSSFTWVTNASGGDYFTGTIGPTPIIVFDLGSNVALSEISVWGYSTSNANGVSEFSLRFATSAEGLAGFGSSITDSPTFAPVIDYGPRQSFAFDQLVVARFVELTCEDNFYANGGNGPPGGGDRVGLGEVAFEDSGPNPNPVIELAAALDFGNPQTLSAPLLLPLEIANLGGDVALQITAATLTPGRDSDGVFSLAGIPLTVAAGDNSPIDVTFDPTAEGCYSARLELATNDPDRPTVTVLLIGGLNCQQPVPEKPLFSVAGGTFTGSLQVALSTPTPGAHVVFTTDGSPPSLTNGSPYETPLTISASTQLRAATISGTRPPAIATESYVRLAADLAAYSAEIPILVVENFAAGAVPDKGWTTNSQTGGGLIQPARQPAYLAIFDTDPTTGTATIAASPDTGSRIGIRVRGAFSSTWNPKPYALEAWKGSRDEDRDISPLGMPAESDWILYFPYPTHDRTMLSNTFIWELGAQTGRYGTRFRWVDVFVNEDGDDLQLSDRRGVYALAEKVKRGADRIDFKALSDDGATGGWLLGINRMDAIPAAGYPTANGATSPQFFHTPGPDRTPQTPANSAGRGDDIPRQYNAFINFESPNGYRINTDQRAAVETWFATFEDILYDDDRWLDPTTGYRSHLDTTDFITYFQLLNLGKQGDGLLLSMFPWVSSGERKLHMGPMWDFNNGAFRGSTNSPLYFRQDRLWYPRLFADPSFLREYIDRWFELRRGPLSDANMAAIIDRQAAGIPDALVPAQGVSLSSWRSRVADMKSWLTARAGWVDSQYFAPPTFAHPGGVVGPGFAFSLTNNTPTVGDVFYTTDDSDPMDDPMGATAVAYSAPVTLATSATVRARSRSTTGQWSALNTATYVVGTPADSTNLAISEIMYHPADGTGAEFLELLNISPTDTIDLTGATFTTGLDYAFPVGTTLAPGARLLLTQPAFQNTTRLANGGERITLTGTAGATIRDFAYDDKTPWPTSPDGGGPSLVLIGPASNPDHALPGSWRPSTTSGGNPGNSDALPFPGGDLVTYALAAAPEVAIGPSGALEYTSRLNIGADAVNVAIETSPDLFTWTTATGTLLRSAHDGSGILTLTHQFPTAAGRSFIRTKVTER